MDFRYFITEIVCVLCSKNFTISNWKTQKIISSWVPNIAIRYNWAIETLTFKRKESNISQVVNIFFSQVQTNFSYGLATNSSFNSFDIQIFISVIGKFGIRKCWLCIKIYPLIRENALIVVELNHIQFLYFSSAILQYHY